LSLDAVTIRGFPMFRGLGEAEAVALGDSLRSVTLAPGETLFHQGDHGSSMFLLVAGQVDVRIQVQGDRDHTRATLQPGAVLGELALLVKGSRTATIVADTDAEMWEISRDAFQAAVDRGDRWAVGLLLAVARELAQRFSTLSDELVVLTEELEHTAEPQEPKVAELARLRTRLLKDWAF
jgi:CRP-like cAMP-binding protein